MKLYTVSVELIAMVLAESPEKAKEIAQRDRAMTDALSSCFADEYDCAENSGVLDGGYEGDSLVYSDLKRDITFDEAIELAKADAPEKDDPNQIKLFDAEDQQQ